MWRIPARNAWLKNCCLLELTQPLVDSQLWVDFCLSRGAEIGQKQTFRASVFGKSLGGTGLVDRILNTTFSNASFLGGTNSVILIASMPVVRPSNRKVLSRRNHGPTIRTKVAISTGEPYR